MSRIRPLAETIHLAALGLWLGAIVMAGVAAAIIFPTIKSLDPHIPSYTSFTGDHWMVVAGHAANGVFVAADIIQFICASLCILTMALLLFRARLPIDRPSAYLRVAGLAIAICVFAFYAIYLRTRMDLNIRGFWEAAQAGRNEDAARFQKVFDADHPLASTLMGTIAVTTLVTLLSAAWNAATAGVAPPPPRPKLNPSRYEEPALLRGRR
jgi:hypothetical protein